MTERLRGLLFFGVLMGLEMVLGILIGRGYIRL